jgi:hypothetical protein
MQDELTKHGLKIYKTMSDKKHSFGEKFREIFIEIAIIVFAVTLSIYVHSWSEHRHEQKEVKEFLRGLKTDLTNDLVQLKDNRDSIAKIATLFDTAFQHRKDHLPDSVQLNIQNIHGSISIYDSTAKQANTLLKIIDNEQTQ